MNEYNKTYNYGWIDFLAGNNVVEVRNAQDFEIFKLFLKKHGLLDILRDVQTFEGWQHLAIINNRATDIFLFEYNNSKGLTWYSDRKAAIDWYGVKPLSASEDLFSTEEFIPTANYLKHQELLLSLSIANIAGMCDALRRCTGDIYIPESVENVLNEAKTNIPCPHCGEKLYISDLPQYEYVCASCDENF